MRKQEKIHHNQRKTIRTFVAIEPGENLKMLLTDTIEKLKRMGFKGNWTKPENIHLTLFFLGNLNMHKIVDIAYKMGERISGFPSFVYEVEKLGYFAQGDNLKTLWFGVHGGKTLEGIYSEVKKSIIFNSIDVSKETFVPHITVGRIKRYPDHWKALLESIDFERIEIPVDSIGLYSSTLTKRGPIYKKMYTIDFEGGVIING
ncbi:RNA 2',3'-cyclic phosphodiesterase [Geotoga petraea]|jgi:2'-5' RNA ligase|uniref:RNA 2',3'-cyclic phosphodiesterase n=1 Tax=Geotoga petraea TaxID=28234 RepID=A0A4Z0W0W5_9BACT|nr:RNA 2',3'-cyclic phosphodiesterase [Geotoga petraea]TGG87800.1 RNA 2',3'-cyclic phosphodiesterase [Geotoga petraea]